MSETTSLCRGYNWYSVEEQVKSVEKLLQHDWLHVLPGHGRPAHFASVEERTQQVQLLLEAER